MPKLDKQGRITIPSELRQKANLDSSELIAVCYDFQNKTITLCNEKNIDNKCVLSFRKLESKGRIALPEDVHNLLGINEDEIFIVYLQNGELFITGMDGTRTWF